MMFIVLTSISFFIPTRNTTGSSAALIASSYQVFAVANVFISHKSNATIITRKENKTIIQLIHCT